MHSRAQIHAIKEKVDESSARIERKLKSQDATMKAKMDRVIELVSIRHGQHGGGAREPDESFTEKDEAKDEATPAVAADLMTSFRRPRLGGGGDAKSDLKAMRREIKELKAMITHLASAQRERGRGEEADDGLAEQTSFLRLNA